jgi:putative ABC transport system permease protein
MRYEKTPDEHLHFAGFETFVNTRPKKRRMLMRMLLRSIIRGRGRTLSALLAIVVAAAAATAMLNLFVDVQAKLHSEFQNYGANVIIVAKDGQSLPANALSVVDSTLAGRGLAVPFAYVVARTASGRAVVVAGTDFAAVQKLDHWWSVTAWPGGPQQALLGTRTAQSLDVSNRPFSLSFQGESIQLTPTGTLQTGSSEDSRIYISLSDFEKWTGVGTSTIQLAVPGSSAEINATIQKLAQILPSADVSPIRQIMAGEANVLGKTRSTMLYSAILIIATAALCLLATLIGWIYDRRRDFAIMKALGASSAVMNGFFAGEATLLGIVGAVAGFALGVGAAIWIGHASFHTAVVPRFGVFPVVLLGSVLVSLASALLPILLLQQVQPANILRGE